MYVLKFYVTICFLAYVCSQIKESYAISDFVREEWVGDRKREVHHVFIRCEDKKDAYERAKEKGNGVEPLKHRPHRDTTRQQFWHYHIANHDLSYENGQWMNYHFYWGKDRDGNRG